jgi:hypothetical protein
VRRGSGIGGSPRTMNFSSQAGAMAVSMGDDVGEMLDCQGEFGFALVLRDRR